MTRLTFILVLAISISCDKPTKNTPKQSLNPSWYNVAFLITDGVYNTEFTAPFDIFQHTKYREGIKAMNVFSVSNKSDAVVTFEGLRIMPDYNFSIDSIPHIDILVIPSAEHHLDSDLENKDLLNWIKTIGTKAQYVTSHCDGAFMLAKTGLLDGAVSTTFPGDVEAYRKMFPTLDIRDSTLFVHDGKFITSAGGAKSFEASLYLTELLYGKKVAEQLAKGLVIDWDLSIVPHTIITD